MNKINSRWRNIMMQLPGSVALLLAVLMTGLAQAAAEQNAAKPELPPLPVPTLSNVAYGDHERNVLDFWRADSDEPTPLVFHMHGGGWVNGDKQDVRKTPVQDYLDAGISVVSINYRYVPQAAAEGIEPPVKGPMMDAARALQFVRSKAGAWNIDKERIGVTGNSAGACTTLWLALHDDLADPDSSDPVARESTRVWCVASSEPQTTLDPQQMKEWIPNSRYGGHAFGFPTAKSSERNEELFGEFLAGREQVLPWIEEYSPYAQASADDPPVYLFFKSPPAVGKRQDDPTHSANFGVKLKERLDELGVNCELVYPGAPDIQHESRAAFLIATLNQPHLDEPKVVIIGDSTVSNYKEDSPKRGWGQMIHAFFNDRITIDNRARSGRSTKTFIEQGLWDEAMALLHAGDYVLIQFGHNDSHAPGRPESTDAFGAYQTYLQQYIDDVRAKGAEPILVTPMHRRSFDDKGRLMSCRITDEGKRDGDLAPYAEAMKQVAASNRVACIDLFSLSGEYMQRIGDEACIELLAPDDRTHWNENGAKVMASLVAKGIAESDSSLKNYLASDTDGLQ